ncbi:hypothetical protein GHT06_010532 [Daphnia sinensis]|uniref:BTB domain-containing protein n=1 Tax=Daphnia sinensis TaxID=1820382 RepID=A0AAD5LJB9_9CRUS|nr:hypothetical protein GHT06_010532 [Daphnia sinensis]
MSIKVSEMRRGLFKISWTMESLGHDDVTIQKGVFHVFHNAVRSTFIVYSRSRKPSLIDYADVCIMLKKKANQLDEENLVQISPARDDIKTPVCKNGRTMSLTDNYETPLFVWIENEVLPVKSSIIHLEDAWQTFMLITNYNEPKITLWMDFGSNSSGQTRMIKDFAELFINQTNCDVQFRIQGITIGAHVVILSARSSVFAAMFQCDMQESRTKKVVIEDIEPEVFRQLLHYLYTGTCPLLKMKSITQDLFVAADEYDIATLKEECIDILLAQLEMSNSIGMLIWSHLHSITILFDASIKCIATHGQTVCFLPEWKDLTHDYPDLCLVATQQMMTSKIHASVCESDCETECEPDLWLSPDNVFKSSRQTDCENDAEWLEFPEQIRGIASLIKL